MGIFELLRQGQPPAFSAENLRVLLATKVFPGGRSLIKNLSDDSLHILAEKLNGQRAFYLWMQFEMKPELEEALPSIRAAELLLKELPKLSLKFRYRHGLSAAAFPDYFNKLIKEQEDVLFAACSALQALFEKSFRFRPMEHLLGGEYDTWRGYAIDIASSFREAVRASHPTAKPLGNGEDSPLAKFVAAVIPGITEENPTVQNVSMGLRRLAKANPDRADH